MLRKQFKSIPVHSLPMTYQLFFILSCKGNTVLSASGSHRNLISKNCSVLTGGMSPAISEDTI